jgi:hypothetical protein
VSGSLYITVRAHDLNYEDRVTISVKQTISPNFPARQISVSDSYWSNLKWLGETYCPRMSKDGRICEDGWWERTGGSQTLNPKPYILHLRGRTGGSQTLNPTPYTLHPTP